MAIDKIEAAGLSTSTNQPVFRNLLINSDMNIAQRSTSVTGLGDGDEGYVTVDRFRHTAAASAGRFTSKQTAVDDLDGFQNCLELDCTTADTSIASTELLQIDCRLEGQDMQHFKKGETIHTESSHKYLSLIHI